MDKRKIQKRGLHKNINLPSVSQSSADTEDMFLSSASRVNAIISQRESNTDLLRKQINSSALSTTSSHATNLDDTNEKTVRIKRPHCNDDVVSKSQSKRKIVSQQTKSNNKSLIIDESDDLTNNDHNNIGYMDNVPLNIQRNITQRKNKNRYQIESSENFANETNNFKSFLIQAGVTLNDDDDNADSFTIDNDPLDIVKKMVQLLHNGDFTPDEIIQEWNTHIISNVNSLKQCLNSTNIINSDGINKRSFSKSTTRQPKCISLIKILLQVPQLQTRILNSLLQKLNETVVLTDKLADEPWTYQLLQQLRFIETINDPQLLTLKLEELLETCPIWFQRELIAFLPDIAIDSQHENIAQILCRLMEIHSDLTNVILDCITNLSLGKESQEDLREKMLNMLQHNCPINKIPAIIRFCLNDCSTIESCQNVLRVIRTLELQPLSRDNTEEYYTNQMMIVNAMKMNIMLNNDMANAVTIVTNCTDNNPKPFDIIMLLLLYDGTLKKRKAEAIFKQHVKSGYYNAKLLDEFYNNYKQIAYDLQPIALRMASNFLKLDDRILIEFASEWFRQQFISHGNLLHKQREIIEKLILLMGNNDQTAKSALAILCKMTKNDNEKRYLQAHCNHLRILMEKVEKLDLEQVMILNDLLHALCSNSNTVSDGLRDDLFILLQKQLSCRRDSMTKSKGVAGAVMAIKHLATNPKCLEMAKEIFQKVLHGIKNCPRSQGFFYDKIGSVIADTPNINRQFLEFVTEIFEQEFMNTYMIDKRDYSGELEFTFGINTQNDSNVGVQFGLSKYGGAIVPALLRLMGICFMQLDDSQNVESISPLLGCSILMPKDLNLPDAHVLDYLFYCTNWFRELINIFVTQPDPILQAQVSKRLDNIIDLQSELSNLLTLAEPRYQSPFCYFHCCPSELPLVKLVEKKIVKKGKQRPASAADNTTGVAEKSCFSGGIVEHREKWEVATLLSTKNPMYFRRLDAKILNLIDITVNSNPRSTSLMPPPSQLQTNVDHISTTQLCFIIKELMVIFEDDADEAFVRDLINLLPKICKKLGMIVKKLESENDIVRDDDDDDYDYDENNKQNKQAVRLVLSFIATIFRWKHFNNPIHQSILRDGIRILAGQVNESNLTISSCKKLVGESYSYFESLAHVATQIPIAFALVDVCKTLMKHSVTFTRQHQDKQAKMAYGFLCLEWPDDRHTGALYKSSVVGLLKNWMDHESNPLDAVTSVLEWLPDQVKKLEKPQDKLATLPPINKSNFHLLLLKIFDGLMKGTKISLSSASADVKKLEIWRNVGDNVQKIVSICKIITLRNTLMVYLRFMPMLLKQFLIYGMPIFERNLRYHTHEITGILKMMQGGTRYLNAVCVHSTEKKDLALTKLVPTAKTMSEKFVYSVKGMLVLNNSPTAFWMGNLVNKNLEGQEILSQTSSNSIDGDITSSVQDTHTSDDAGIVGNNDLLSDLLDSDENDDDMIMNDEEGVIDNDDDDDDNDNNEQD
ncbi:hypothetical protein PV327_001492 [Microctonus hyperodae]|uniref:Fanconi anemia group D2 protein n=1 Tax=Microctonus hyperodae TaxID=165561 RepID=A0AA39G9K1_MICHY|nr:hypothetical protein PV327_001492 [Microctonus hyperodae]